MGKGQSETIIIKLGGSLIVPNGGLNVNYIKQFQALIREQIADKNRRFFLFIGGGLLSRHYRDAGAEITGHSLPPEELDWLGIHATRLNAQLFRTIFRDLADPHIIFDYDEEYTTDAQIVIAGGWKPGWSTDYCAITLAKNHFAQKVIKLSNIDRVYDKDPNKNKDAKAFDNLSWDEYISIIGSEWTPGKSLPIDPVAAKLAKEHEIKVIFVDGHDLKNAGAAINEESFSGTTIT